MTLAWEDGTWHRFTIMSKTVTPQSHSNLFIVRESKLWEAVCGSRLTNEIPPKASSANKMQIDLRMCTNFIGAKQKINSGQNRICCTANDMGGLSGWKPILWPICLYASSWKFEWAVAEWPFLSNICNRRASAVVHVHSPKLYCGARYRSCTGGSGFLRYHGYL